MKQSRRPIHLSFRDALRGLHHAFKERNFLIQFTVGVFVIVFSYVFSVTMLERIILGMLVVMVLSLEMFNTALERFINFHISKLDPRIAEIKDLMAGAVLLVVVLAVIVGIWIFL